LDILEFRHPNFPKLRKLTVTRVGFQGFGCVAVSVGSNVVPGLAEAGNISPALE